MSPFFEARDLSVEYSHRPHGRLRHDTIRAVRQVSLQLEPGKTLGVIGGSGSGKSSLARALVGLEPLTGGRVLLQSQCMLSATQQRPPEAYRRRVQFMFQDPRDSLDPARPAWWLVTEGLHILKLIVGSHRRDAATELLGLVGLGSEFLDRLPHELSGGQRQRLAFARAISTRPELLILDEPTASLDVSIQAEILNLILDMQTLRGLSVIFISHDLGVIAHMSDYIAVMHAGTIVEEGDAPELLASPREDFTRRLLARETEDSGA